MSLLETVGNEIELRRIGRAAIVLSLDIIVPIYPYLEVPAAGPREFNGAIRAAIVETRALAAVADEAVSNLRAAIDASLVERLGAEAARRFG